MKTMELWHLEWPRPQKITRASGEKDHTHSCLLHLRTEANATGQLCILSPLCLSSLVYTPLNSLCVPEALLKIISRIKRRNHEKQWAFNEFSRLREVTPTNMRHGIWAKRKDRKKKGKKIVKGLYT